jgi:hypothetical protein
MYVNLLSSKCSYTIHIDCLTETLIRKFVSHPRLAGDCIVAQGRHENAERTRSVPDAYAGS